MKFLNYKNNLNNFFFTDFYNNIDNEKTTPKDNLYDVYIDDYLYQYYNTNILFNEHKYLQQLKNNFLNIQFNSKIKKKEFKLPDIKNYKFNLNDDFLEKLENIVDDFNDSLNYPDYFYYKFKVKNRKVFKSIKKGLTKNEKLDSVKRDKLFTVLQQFYNMINRRGNKITIHKNINKAVEKFYSTFEEYNESTNDYKDFDIFDALLKADPKYFYNFKIIFSEFVEPLESLFDIRVIKQPKKTAKFKKEKDQYEVIYIKKLKRIKNVLKLFNIYTESYKNYKMWDRLFLMLSKIILDQRNSFLTQRRDYVYKKAIKFYRKTKKAPTMN